MPSFCSVVIVGHLTRNPELRFTPKGTAIARFSLGFNRQWKDDKGNLREEATFVDVESFGDFAKYLAEHLHTGEPVLVQGRLRQDTWKDKESGKARSRLFVVCEHFRFLRPASKPTDTDQPPPPQSDQPF